MSVTSSSICGLLDIPEEILIEIILHLNARERVALGNSCQRLNSLVFGAQELLRDLDFSVEGRLTSLTDISQYFSEENICKHVLKLNLRNVICMRKEGMLNSLIGKATNLVDVNIRGIIFSNIKQFGDFLKPLVNLRRLSVDWPEVTRADVDTCYDLLEEPLSKLLHLTLDTSLRLANFLPVLPLCEKLEELCIDADGQDDQMWLCLSWGLECDKLKNLKIVQVCGYEAMSLRDELVSILTDEQEWTEFLLVDSSCDQGFYFEKNVEVCEELQKTKVMEIESTQYHYSNRVDPISLYIVTENLLREVIRITHEDVPETFCCFTPESPRELDYQDLQACLLKIDEAKQLLRNPEYQISFLQFKHTIEADCDAHLIASAFPNLTVLMLNEISKSKGTEKHFQRRLKRKGSAVPEKQDDGTSEDSSFKLLVENTPHVKDFSMFGNMHRPIEFEMWDLDAFCLISRWKNLTTLRLKQIPLIDGNFLIDIGKECPKLETIMLHNLGQSHPCCWTSGLSQMLRYCSNLKKFTMYQCWPYIDDLPEVLNSLCNNVKLRTVRIVFDTKVLNKEIMISSVEQLLRQCPELTTFVFDFKSGSENSSSNLNDAINRIREELNRPNFQFEGTYYWQAPEVYEDAPTSFFPFKWDWFYYP